MFINIYQVWRVLTALSHRAVVFNHRGGLIMKELIFYGRGGQGVVTAAKWLVSAAVIEQKYAHALPAFGQERKGAPVYAYARLDSQAVSTKSFVYTPDCAVVFDSHLPALGVDYTSGIKGDKILVLNSNTELDSQIASAFST